MGRLLMLVVLTAYACATTTYYVSASAGNDGNDGTTAATAWKTLAKVNGSSFAAGDRILLARGDVWRESLIPPSSGTSGNPISFDAYGTGAAPEITAYLAVSGWTQVTGYTNQWQASVTATGMNYVQFGTIWGAKQTSQSAVQRERDFYFSGNTLYVYAPSDPSAYYGTVAAMVLTNTPLISVNGKSWLTFQHIKLEWFDQYGVAVTGASDSLVFANMEADGMIPAGIFPLGFYVNATNPASISFYNDSAHLNYDGFRIDGTATAISLVNCAAYANRDTGLTDNTGGHVSYSYSHFYANGTGGIESLDVVGAIAGTGNLAPDTAPNVQAFARYPARFSFTVDDVGLYAGTDTFVDALLPVFNARGLKLNAAIVAAGGVSFSTTDAANWIASGHEVDSHSWSHQYFTDPQYLSTNHIFNSTNPTPATAFSLRYVGTGTAATVTVSGGILSTSVTGGPGGQNLNLNLAASAYDTVGELTSYIAGTYPGVYSVTTWTTPLMRGAAHSMALANISGQDIKTAAYGLPFDPTRAVTGLMADEATQSRTWLQTNIAGLSNVKVYVYPDGVTDPAFEAAVAAAGYEGARGTLSMCVSGAAPCAGANAFVSYATGVNAQNITSLTPVAWSNYSSLTQKQLDAKVAALIFKMRVWGYPVGLFVHASDYPDGGTAAMKTGWLLDSIAGRGGTITRTDELIEAVLAMKPISGTTKYVSAAEGELDLSPTAGAPGIGKGWNEGPSYGRDLAGAARPVSGDWDIGAYQILWTKHGTAGTGQFVVGNSGCGGFFCSPSDQEVDQTSAPEELLGLYGAGAAITDITGNRITRITDYGMSGGASSSASFRANSNSNDNVWSIDDKAVGVCRTAGNQYVVAWDPVTRTATPKGVTAGKGGCDGVSWSHATPMTYFYTSGNSLLVKGTIDTTHAAWTGATGGNSNIAGAVTTENLMDISRDCPGLAFSRYNFLADIYGADANDRYLSFGTRLSQDNGFQVIAYDAQRGCHWIDLRTMTEGGSWGHVGAIAFGGTLMLPAPAAPTLTAATGGTLTAGHEYAVCLTYTKSGVGETPCSSETLITVSDPNNAITVTQPTATPTSTAAGPTGFNVYACDRTATPGCSPVQQSNGGNGSGVLLQPTGLSVACNTNCTGSTTYTIWLYASNGGGQSPLSAPIVTPAAGTNATFTLTANQVANATTYTVLLDYLYQTPLRDNAGTCAAGVCTFSVNTNSNAVTYRLVQNQTMPIGVPALLSAMANGTTAPPITNTTGIPFHDVKSDPSGVWVYAGSPAAGNLTQHGGNPALFDLLTGTLVWMGGENRSYPELNIANMNCGHRVMGYAQMMCNEGYSGYQTKWTLQDSSAATDASKVVLNQLPGFAMGYDVHFSAQMQYNNPDNPWYVGSDGGGTNRSHNVPETYLGTYLFATENKANGRIWKLCQTWESGMSGFNTNIGGNISPDGKFVLFSSDMGIGEGVSSGQLGSTSGASSCTDNVDCRTDAFVCSTR